MATLPAAVVDAGVVVVIAAKMKNILFYEATK